MMNSKRILISFLVFTMALPVLVVGCGDGKKRVGKISRKLPARQGGKGGGANGKDEFAAKKAEIEAYVKTLGQTGKAVGKEQLATGDYQLVKVETNFHYSDGTNNHVETLGVNTVSGDGTSMVQDAADVAGVLTNTIDKGYSMEIPVAFTVGASGLDLATMQMREFSTQVVRSNLKEGFNLNLLNSYSAQSVASMLASSGQNTTGEVIYNSGDNNTALRIRQVEADAKVVLVVSTEEEKFTPTEGDAFRLQRRGLFLTYAVKTVSDTAPGGSQTSGTHQAPGSAADPANDSDINGSTGQTSDTTATDNSTDNAELGTALGIP